jgi:hypothetical protein
LQPHKSKKGGDAGFDLEMGFTEEEKQAIRMLSEE